MIHEHESERENQEGAVPFQRPVWWNYSISGQVHKSTLSWSEKYVYMTLHYYLSHNGSTCFPKSETISVDTSLSRRTVFRALKSLSEKGIIKRHQQFDDKTGQQRPTFYEIFQIPDEFLIVNNKNKSPSKMVIQNEIPIKHVSKHVPEIENADMTLGGCQSGTGIKCASVEGEGVSMALGGCQCGTGGSATVAHHYHNHNDHLPNDQKEERLPSERSEKETRPPTFGQGSGALTEAEAKNEKIEKKTEGKKTIPGVPPVLPSVVSEFLRKIGRNSLSSKEHQVLDILSGYLPSQIMEEVSLSVERFRRLNRPLRAISLNYIVSILGRKAPTANKLSEAYQEELAEMKSWTYADTRKYSKKEVKELSEMGGGVSFEELVMLCEACHLSERETLELCEEFSVPVMMSA